MFSGQPGKRHDLRKRTAPRECGQGGQQGRAKKTKDATGPGMYRPPGSGFSSEGPWVRPLLRKRSACPVRCISNLEGDPVKISDPRMLSINLPIPQPRVFSDIDDYIDASQLMKTTQRARKTLEISANWGIERGRGPPDACLAAVWGNGFPIRKSGFLEKIAAAPYRLYLLSSQIILTDYPITSTVTPHH
ncbi:hypothetical protein LMG28688_03359 [Paraburkholderia caffeinitolerans]|uniref:Uncharacterized protein n=1 Tax=Paraburkholderia caffeinitolerans TaxID=1723730 RepID=A0A6J5G452_9BURK|nr:hypothetical protein LMG28688_03359 [Paraburkholderia caffeinitolerans]